MGIRHEEEQALPVLETIENTTERTENVFDLSDLREKIKETASKADRAITTSSEEHRLTIERIFNEYSTVSEKNESILTQIQNTNNAFTTENKIVKNLVNNIAVNVDKEISFSRNTLERIKILFSFINEIMRASEILHTDSDFLISLMQSLEDISDKIHILSINASIIASRSGEAGKAFMVVAKDERSLSDNVKKSIYEMKRNSEKLTNSINEVTTNIRKIDAETKSTHEAINNLLMRFEGLNLSINIIEKKVDSNTDLIKKIESLILQQIDNNKNIRKFPDNRDLLDMEKLRVDINHFLNEIIESE